MKSVERSERLPLCFNNSETPGIFSGKNSSQTENNEKKMRKKWYTNQHVIIFISSLSMDHPRLFRIRNSEQGKHWFLKPLLYRLVTIVVGISDILNPETSRNLTRHLSLSFFFPNHKHCINKSSSNGFLSCPASNTREIKSRYIIEKVSPS